MINLGWLKKRAKKITKKRSLKPDAEYIFTAFLTAVTIIGLPITYSIIKEYHQYLCLCRNEFDNSDESNEKKVYEHKRISNIEFDYNVKSAIGAVKAAIYVLLMGSMFVEYKHLTERQNLEMKLWFSQMKMYFSEIFITEVIILFAVVSIPLFHSLLVTFICVSVIVVLIIVMFKPFVAYCQMIVMVEKIMSDTKKDEDDI